MTINAKELTYQKLNEHLHSADSEYKITNCIGQRFIATGASNKKNHN